VAVLSILVPILGLLLLLLVIIWFIRRRRRRAKPSPAEW
jgi:LPXTG-motif cell wall-anchored protein